MITIFLIFFIDKNLTFRFGSELLFRLSVGPPSQAQLDCGGRVGVGGVEGQCTLSPPLFEATGKGGG